MDSITQVKIKKKIRLIVKRGTKYNACKQIFTFPKKIKKSNKTLEKKPETNDNKKINFINIF